MARSWFRIFSLAILVCLLPTLGSATQVPVDFATWLADFAREAATAGISDVTLKTHLTDLQPIPRIIQLDRGQAPAKVGKRVSYRRYLQGLVPDATIKTAREQYRQNLPLLQEISLQYGVDPRVIVALWGIESDFGRHSGTFPVIPALATLAHEGRRGAFFRGELLQLLKLIDQGAINIPEPLGSWAGAMGQVQFMPSAFRDFAVDFDGDGQRDLWTSTPDALASAANYLAKAGWKEQQGWSQPVLLPKGFKTSLSGPEQLRSLKEWRRLGVKGVKGPEHREAALILPDGAGGDAFLVGKNFRVLRAWNRSNLFALAVCQLAAKIGE